MLLPGLRSTMFCEQGRPSWRIPENKYVCVDFNSIMLVHDCLFQPFAVQFRNKLNKFKSVNKCRKEAEIVTVGREV